MSGSLHEVAATGQYTSLEGAPQTGIPILPSSWPRGVRLEQDFTMANAVSPASVPGMSIDLPAGEYVVQYHTVHQDATPEQGHQTRLYFGGASCYSVTSGIHGNTGLTGALPNFMAFPQAGANLTGTTGTNSESIVSGTGVQFGGALITTMIVAQAPFTLSLQTSQLVNATNTTTTMKAGSWMSVMPLNALVAEVPPVPVPALSAVLTVGNDCAGQPIRSLGAPLDANCAVSQGTMQAAINTAIAGLPPVEFPAVEPAPVNYGPYRYEDTNPTGVIRLEWQGRLYDMVVTDKGAAPVTQK